MQKEKFVNFIIYKKKVFIDSCTILIYGLVLFLQKNVSFLWLQEKLVSDLVYTKNFFFISIHRWKWRSLFWKYIKKSRARVSQFHSPKSRSRVCGCSGISSKITLLRNSHAHKRGKKIYIHLYICISNVWLYVSWVWARKRDQTLKRENCQVSPELDWGGGCEKKGRSTNGSKENGLFKNRLRNFKLLNFISVFLFYFLSVLYL